MAQKLWEKNADYTIPLSETLSFGDGGNDIPMLRHTGFSVAMEYKAISAVARNALSSLTNKYRKKMNTNSNSYTAC